LGATWDPELISKVGGMLGRDAKAKGSSMLLAPTVNIQRNPLNGRVSFKRFHILGMRWQRLIKVACCTDCDFGYGLAVL
jgi:hypothetical protein